MNPKVLWFSVRITDFPIRDHKVILVLRRRRWKNKETGETFVDRISVIESETRYSKEFAFFFKRGVWRHPRRPAVRLSNTTM